MLWDHQRTCEQFLILGFSRGEAGQQLLQPLLLLQGRQWSTSLCNSILDSSADSLKDAMHEDPDFKMVSKDLTPRVPGECAAYEGNNQAHSQPLWCMGGS